MFGTSYHSYRENFSETLKTKTNKITTEDMETVMIDCAEKFTRMADLAAAADEYRYNDLIDPTFQLNMARCTITPDYKKKGDRHAPRK